MKSYLARDLISLALREESFLILRISPFNVALTADERQALESLAY